MPTLHLTLSSQSGRGRLSLPLELLGLLQAQVNEHAAAELRHQIVDGLRVMVERRNNRENACASLLRRQHIPQMNTAEGRVSNSQDQLAAFLEADVGGALD